MGQLENCIYLKGNSFTISWTHPFWAMSFVGFFYQTHCLKLLLQFSSRFVGILGWNNTLNSLYCTVYPKKYAPGVCIAVLCCGYTLTDFPILYPSGLLHWHCGNLTIASVPAKQPWWIWINTSCEFIMNDCITTTKQSTTKQCAYFLGYTVCPMKYAHDTIFIWFELLWLCYRS